MAGSNTVVNTNIMALNTHRSLTNVGNKQAKASERLSSGLRINSAADDAAGLAISEKMRAQIRGLDMASKNSQDAISLIQTAEGGMQEIDNMLQRIRELVVQASNDTNDQESGDRTRIQEEINQLVEEIDSMSTRVEFNKKKVISGDFSDGVTKDLVDIRTYQPVDTSGSSSSTDTSTVKEITREDRQAAYDVINAMVANNNYDYDSILDAYNLTDIDGSGSGDISGEVDAFALAMANLLSDTKPTLITSDDIKTVITALDAITTELVGMSGSEVTAISTNIANVRSILEGAYESILEPAITPSMPMAATGNADNIGASLVAMYGTVNIYQVVNAAGAAAEDKTFKDILTDATNFSNTSAAWEDLVNATSKEEMEEAWAVFYTAFDEEMTELMKDNVAVPGSPDLTLAGKPVTASFLTANETALHDLIGTFLADKLDAYEAPEINEKKGKASEVASSYNDLLTSVVFNSVTLNDILTGDTYKTEFSDTRYAWEALRSAETVADMETAWDNFVTTFNDEMLEYADILPTGTSSTSVATYGLGDLKDKFETYFSNKLAALTKTPEAAVDVQTNTLFFQVGANANQKLEININAINTKSLGIGNGEGESWIDIDKFSGSSTTDLLTGLDDAISYVTVERSKLGAAQNRLEYTIKSLDISSENLSSAESRIRDTDMAKEMMNYTQANVLQQAAISMLAQANQQPQNLLSLLR